MNKYPSERLFCLNIVLTVDEKWFTARIKPPQVRLIPVADDMSEETGRFRLESLGRAPPCRRRPAQAADVLLYLRSHCFDDLRQAGSHVSQYGTGVDSQAAHSEYQSSLLVVRAARVPLRAPKSMDFGTGSTSEAF